MNKNILLVLLLLLTTFFVKHLEAITCNEYPRFIGGNTGTGQTFLYHIDAHLVKDQFAVVGKTNDTSLVTGAIAPTFYPYIAVQKIATMSYLWSKVFLGRSNEQFSQVAYSADGSWLVVHGCCTYESPIYVFDSSDGTIKTAKTYSNSLQDSSHFNKIRTILIESGTTPNVYVLSRFMQPSSSTCGQHLFKFSTVSSPALHYAFQNSQDCIPYGLSFGRDELFVYGYGKQQNKPSHFLMTQTGTIVRTIQHLSCCVTPMLDHFKFDSATDMVVLTGGATKIEYGIYLSSITAPSYAISKSKVYQEDTDYSKKSILSFLITSSTKFQSLVLDQTTMIVSVAVINIGKSQSTTYQQLLPKFDASSFAFGSFIDGANHIVGSDAQILYTNKPSPISFPMTKRTAFVMTSDVINNICCYILSTQPSYKAGLTSGTPVTALSPTLFLTSTGVFTLQAESITNTISINQNALIDFSIDCPQQPFTIQTTTQSKTDYSFIAGNAYTFPITPYSATQNCGTVAPTFSYTEIDLSLNQPAPPNDFISVALADGKISVSTLSQTGTYQIRIVGTLPNSLQTSADFTLNGLLGGNLPPYFLTSLVDQNLQLSTSKNYVFPATFDPETSGSATIVSCLQSDGSSLPTFITYSSALTSITINPTTMSHVGTTVLKVTITDTVNTESFTFRVIVSNQAPILLESPPSDVYFDFNKDQILNLPKTQDPEGLPYTTKLLNIAGSTASNFITVLSNQQLRVYPRVCRTDVGTHLITLSVEDQQPVALTYSFNLIVNNLAPVQYLRIPNQAVKVASTLQLTLLNFFIDPEGCNPLLFEEIQEAKLAFLSITDKGDLILNPKYSFQKGTYEVKLLVKDYQGLQTESDAFNVTVYDSPKFIVPIIKQQVVSINSVLTYHLPVDLFAEDQFIKNLSMPSSFATFEYPAFTFKPQQKQSIGKSYIQGSLCNPYTCTSFSFSLSVINTAPEFSGYKNSQILPLIRLKAFKSNQTTTLYHLPAFHDLETPNLVNISFIPSNLPPFIKYLASNNQLALTPSVNDTGKHTLAILLTDSYGLSSKVYTLEIFVIEEKETDNDLVTIVSGSQSVVNSANVTHYFVTFQILWIMRDGTASIQIISQSNQNAEIVKRVTNTTFQIVSINQSQDNNVSYQVLSRDLKKETVLIQIRFQNPSLISKGLNYDQIKFVVTQQIKIRSNQSNTQLHEGTQCIKSIPPQLSSNLEKSVVKFFRNGRLNFSKNQATNFLLAILAQLIWSQLDDLTFMLILSIMSLTIPGVALVIQNSLLNLLYYDLFYTEEWMPQVWKLMGYQEDDDEQLLNEKFSENGFQSIFFIKNSGSTLVFLLVYYLAWLAFFIIKVASPKSSLMNKIQNKLRTCLIWNGSITFMNAQFSIIIMCCLINLSSWQKKDRMMRISNTLSVIFLVKCIFYMASVFVVTWKKQSLAESYSSLKDGLKQVSVYPALWLIRMSLTTVILIWFRDLTAIQVILLLLLSLAHQAFLLQMSPHDQKSTHYISLFNEAVGVSCYIYGCIAILLDENNQLNDFIGWYMAIVIIGVTSINVVYTTIKILKPKVQKYCQRRAKTVKLRSQLTKIPNQCSKITNNDKSVNGFQYYTRKLPTHKLGTTLDTIIEENADMFQVYQRKMPTVKVNQ